MRIPINLSSEPFRRDRPMVVGSIVVTGMLTALLGLLVFFAMSERNRASEARAMIQSRQKQLASVQREQNRLEAVLRRPENAEVLDRSVFLNALLLRKGVSWTKIFSDLETVTPANVRLVQVRPQIDGKNELLLDMVVASQTAEQVTSFIMQLEGSERFGTTTIFNQLPPSQSEPLFRFRLNVQYAQTVARASGLR